MMAFELLGSPSIHRWEWENHRTGRQMSAPGRGQRSFKVNGQGVRSTIGLDPFPWNLCGSQSQRRFLDTGTGT